MNMYRIGILVLLVLVSCQPQNSTVTEGIKCSEEDKVESLVKAVVDISRLQPYLEVQQTIGQKQLVIMKNKNIMKITDIKKFGLPVSFLTPDQILDDQIKAFIEFREIKLSGDSADVYFRYDIQGIGCKSKFYLLDSCNWRLVKTVLWEN